MHNLLNGIVKSSYPENVKLELIEKKLIPAASHPMTVKDSEALLGAAWELATNGDSEIAQNGGIQVFTAWCGHHGSALSKFFTQAHLITALTSPAVVHKDRMLSVVTVALMHMQKDPSFPKLCGVVKTRCISLLTETRGTLSVCTAMVELLEKVPQCMPIVEYYGPFCSVVTTCVTACPYPTQPGDLKQYIQDVNRICAFMKTIWATSEVALKRTLETVHSILTGEEQFSTALAAVVDLLPPKLVSTASSLMKKSGGGSEPLLKASERLLACLGWPGTSNVHNWILAALKGLLGTHSYSVVEELFESQISTVLSKVAHPLTRKCSLPVLSFMLLSYQHSPALFHKVAPHIPMLISMLSNEKHGGETAVRKIAELSQTLMYLHSGFPDLYDPLLDAIKDVPAMAQEEMQQLIAQHKVDSLSDKYSSGLIGDSFLARREDELVGLVNLGNTCYANSVLQALFMTARLRNEILRNDAISKHGVLKKLQELFAFLSLTQRPAFCPEDFLDSSRPPWFARGEQQDCSELLRYLLDCCHEEEKDLRKSRGQRGLESPTLVERTFGGVVRTTYLCSGCGSESANEENVTDLHLAFPEGWAGEGKGYRTRSTARSEQQKAENGEMAVPEEESTKPLSLKNLLENYFKPENMEGDNKYQCDTCNSLMDAQRSVVLTKAPEHLILTLMRFSYDAATGVRTKILREIQYPQLLTLPCSRDSQEEAVYALYSVVVHSGTSTERGHYYTYARLSSQDPQSPRKSSYRSCKSADPLSKRWYLFNDSRVSPSSYAAFEGLTRRFPRDTAYVLFYKRVDLEDDRESDGMGIPPTLRAMVDADNAKYIEEQETRSKRVRWSRNSAGDDDWEPPPGGCGFEGSFGGFGDLPRVVF